MHLLGVLQTSLIETVMLGNLLYTRHSNFFVFLLSEILLLCQSMTTTMSVILVAAMQVTYTCHMPETVLYHR